MKKVWLILLIMAIILPSLGAQQLEVLTEEDPPYSFTGDSGKPEGFGVDTVTEIQRRISTNYPIKIVPWARAYNKVLEQDNTVVFTMSRTRERENLFQWVGPIVENNWVLIGKKDSGISLSTLDDAKKLNNIGTVRDYAWTKYLVGQGFQNLQEVTERSFNVLKLNSGRIDAFVSADSSYKSEITENGLDPDDYEIILSFNSVQMYIAHSRGTSKAIVNTWQSALDDMRNDGTLLTLTKKWLPENNLPGPGKPADF